MRAYFIIYNSLFNRVINLVENGSLSELSVIIGPEGGTSSLCQTEQLNTSQLLYSEVSEWENLTIGRYALHIKSRNNFLFGECFPSECSLHEKPIEIHSQYAQERICVLHGYIFKGVYFFTTERTGAKDRHPCKCLAIQPDALHWEGVPLFSLSSRATSDEGE